MVQRGYLISITKDYWNNFGYASLFVLALVGILIFEKEKIKRYAFLWYSLLTILITYNPISLALRIAGNWSTEAPTIINRFISYNSDRC